VGAQFKMTVMFTPWHIFSIEGSGSAVGALGRGPPSPINRALIVLITSC